MNGTDLCSVSAERPRPESSEGQSSSRTVFRIDELQQRRAFEGHVRKECLGQTLDSGPVLVN
jgi:hypothetical protein